MSKKIIVDFSGWYEIDPEDAQFQYIGEDETKPEVINGHEYANLTEDEQSSYIVEDIIAGQRDAVDGEYDMIDISVENENDDDEEETDS